MKNLEFRKQLKIMETTITNCYTIMMFQNFTSYSFILSFQLNFAKMSGAIISVFVNDKTGRRKDVNYVTHDHTANRQKK